MVLQPGEVALATLAPAPQSAGPHQLGEVHPARLPASCRRSGYCTHYPVIASTPEPKGGARCVSSARRDLRGGRPATVVPTATNIPRSLLRRPSQPATSPRCRKCSVVECGELTWCFSPLQTPSPAGLVPASILSKLPLGNASFAGPEISPSSPLLQGGLAPTSHTANTAIPVISRSRTTLMLGDCNTGGFRLVTRSVLVISH